MYLIKPQLTDVSLNSQGYNHILEGIDKAILCLATTEYQNQTLGFQDYVDMQRYEALCDYREIMMQMLMGCGCLECAHMIEIIHKVKKLING